MAYLTIQVNEGNPFEVKNMEDVFRLGSPTMNLFVEKLEEKIKKNISAKKEPFDGIDFPDASKGHGGSWLLADALNRSDTFVNALRTQPKNETLKNTLAFVSNLDLSHQLQQYGQENSSKRADLLLRTIHGRYLDEETLPLSCQMWCNAYGCVAKRHGEHVGISWGSKENCGF